MKLAADQPRYFFVKNHALAGDICGVKKLADKENPPGQWNRVEILAQGPKYTVRVNGQKVNEAEGVDVVAGPVGLQSEGGEIHFRRATLTPLPWFQIWRLTQRSRAEEPQPNQGTRNGVHDVVALIKAGASVDGVVASFPRLTRAQVYECLAYFKTIKTRLTRW